MSDNTPAVYAVTIELDGQQHHFQCHDNQIVLSAAEEAGVPLPSSCCAGVCTTCAARIQEGEVHQPDAMGVKEDLRKKGFALLCVSFPRSDLIAAAGQEDALYQAQFGQYQS
ncbi:2Fe-2S ferredoxin [Synechococcus sp. BIOS-E4-1]|uniref:2Fe-2S iron-sulfur cluster-binding protein n=1 Tax=Synechococcus sp. BIOS-E4-1 TaxID=1400864 RepID=UPI00164558B0|nr:2Fe-2S iron-sulfur cluster-binding protein [Synechococcus sp. BIOS-E4-1]QNI56015.1 2Fe-2S ferredoxin [Synechococcus sp. BIOS-E4-1]